MAFRDKTIGTPIFSTGVDVPLYNVTSAVGKAGSAPNRRDDVMTVQYFLKLLYDHPASPFRLSNEMKVDGFIGPVTLKFIHDYQDVNARTGYPVRVDDRVDRVREALESSISHTFYTLRAMNRDVAVFYEKDFDNLGKRIDCPPELVSAFSNV